MGKTFLTYSIKQLLGLGGKNAAVVFDDADLDKCVKVLCVQEVVTQFIYKLTI